MRSESAPDEWLPLLHGDFRLCIHSNMGQPGTDAGVCTSTARPLAQGRGHALS